MKAMFLVPHANESPEEAAFFFINAENEEERRCWWDRLNERTQKVERECLDDELKTLREKIKKLRTLIKRAHRLVFIAEDMTLINDLRREARGDENDEGS